MSTEACLSCGDWDFAPEEHFSCRFCRYPMCRECERTSGNACRVCILTSDGAWMDEHDRADLWWCKRMYRERVLRRSRWWDFEVELWRKKHERQRRAMWRGRFKTVIADLHACYLQFMPYRLGDWLVGLNMFCHA